MFDFFEEEKIRNHKEEIKMEYYRAFCNEFKTKKGKEILEEFHKSSCIREYLTNIVFEKITKEINICNRLLSFEEYRIINPKNAGYIRNLKYKLNLVLGLLEKLYLFEKIQFEEE